MGVNEYRLPDVGEGLTEAEIVTWKVEVGDVVAVNDVVVEIETAKSLVELPSPYAGTVTALLAEEGETVPVGASIIVVSDGPELDLSNPAAAGDGENQTLVGYGPKSGAAMRRARRGPATAATMAGSAAQMQVQGSFALGRADSTEVVPGNEDPVPAVHARDERPAPQHPAPAPAPAARPVLAKPPVRRRARELGVDLATLTPSGPGGTVTLADVEAAASRSGPLVERREPVTGVRRAMAQAMVGSAFSAPHVTEWVTVDVTRTTRLVRALRADRGLGGVRLSPLAVLARAVCLAMRSTPEVNAAWDEAAQEVVFRGSVNLGVAAATPRGLVVPNIKGADSMTLTELGAALDRLAAVAKQGRTQPAEMSGGTFTITNVGVFGVDAGTPIINPGEGAILCLGAVRQRPWVHKGKIRPRDVATLALSFDHRFIDGATGSRFLADVAAIMEDPANALRF